MLLGPIHIIHIIISTLRIKLSFVFVHFQYTDIISIALLFCCTPLCDSVYVILGLLFRLLLRYIGHVALFGFFQLFHLLIIMWHFF